MWVSNLLIAVTNYLASLWSRKNIEPESLWTVGILLTIKLQKKAVKTIRVSINSIYRH